MLVPAQDAQGHCLLLRAEGGRQSRQSRLAGDDAVGHIPEVTGAHACPVQDLHCMLPVIPQSEAGALKGQGVHITRLVPVIHRGGEGGFIQPQQLRQISIRKIFPEIYVSKVRPVRDPHGVQHIPGGEPEQLQGFVIGDVHGYASFARVQTMPP